MKTKAYASSGFIILFVSMISYLYNFEPNFDVSQKVDQYLLKYDGIYVENIPSNMDIDKYNFDNIIFKVGSKFTYNYKYLDKKGRIFYTTTNDDTWQFISSRKANKNTIRQVIITSKSGTLSNESNFTQTLISYSYPPFSNYSSSGVIENKKNTWMHPPRDALFKILEINPFPFMRSPYIVGNSWNWKLKVGSQWADKRWKMWEGDILINYHYQIINKRFIKTNLGNLECLEIYSVGNSVIGVTKLNAFFNKKFGFVKLNYTNIDGSKIIFDLVNYETKRQL